MPRTGTDSVEPSGSTTTVKTIFDKVNDLYFNICSNQEMLS
jgi:hypothetical protein